MTVEKRIEDQCRIDKGMRRFLIFWPLLVSFSYILVGLYSVPIFRNETLNSVYDYISISIGILGIISTVFWWKPFLRNIMASVALARAISLILVALLIHPPLPMHMIVRITLSSVLSVLIFAIAIAEIPYLKAMRNGNK